MSATYVQWQEDDLIFTCGKLQVIKEGKMPLLIKDFFFQYEDELLCFLVIRIQSPGELSSF